MKTPLFMSAAVIALCSVSLQLAADIKPNQQAIDRAKAEAEAKRDAGPGAKLRCWQYGELLFEESGISSSALPSKSETILFQRAQNARGDLVLLDFGTATCLYEKP